MTIASKMVPFTMVNGEEQSDMVVVSKSGLMVHDMRENGNSTKLTERANFGMSTEMSLTESGKMIRPMDMGFILTSMERNTKVTGRKISNMDTELRHGLMGLATKDTTRMVRNTVVALTCGQMAPNMSVTGLTIKSMAKASTLG